MKMKFRAALISVAFLGGSIVTGAAYSDCVTVPPVPGPTSNLLKANGVSTEDDAKLYYKTIDPNDERCTQDQWREVNGFNASENAGKVVVVEGHKNTSDLGFWRRLEMVIDQRTDPKYKGNVAFTTYNFDLGPTANPKDNPGKTICCKPENAKSIVNMEYSPGPNGEKFTKFYIYDADGTRKTDTIFDPNPNKAESLFLPSACASCHGGGKDFRANGGKTGGGFLAFDFHVFQYEGDATAQAAARLANEPGVKELNKGVLMTKPPSAVKSLISGLYGKDLRSDTQISTYMPKDWAGAADPIKNVWKEVIVKDCLGCHTLSEQEVLTLDFWKNNVVGDLREVFKKKIMPNSPYANGRFFKTDPTQLPNNHLEIVKGAFPGAFK